MLSHKPVDWLEGGFQSNNEFKFVNAANWRAVNHCRTKDLLVILLRAVTHHSVSNEIVKYLSVFLGCNVSSRYGMSAVKCTNNDRKKWKYSTGVYDKLYT